MYRILHIVIKLKNSHTCEIIHHNIFRMCDYLHILQEYACSRLIPYDYFFTDEIGGPATNFEVLILV